MTLKKEVSHYLLNLEGKDLEREIDRIAKDNPPRNIPWTPKEIDVIRRLRLKKVPAKKIAQLLGRSLSSVQNQFSRV